MTRPLSIALLFLLIGFGVGLTNPTPALAQRSLKDLGRSSKKDKCRKVAIMVDGLRRMRCKKSTSRARSKEEEDMDPMRRKKCTTSSSGKRRCKWITYVTGHAVHSKALLSEPLSKPSGDVWVYAQHSKKEIRLNIYNEARQWDDKSLARLDALFSCRRSRQTRAVDPRLFVILSRIHDHWPGKRVSLVSGFRFQTNESSRHYHAAAMDIRVANVDAQELHDYVETLDRGGMGIGIYPFAKFVHIDFRAPGERSYRWIDISPKDYAERGRELSKRAK